MSVKLQVCQADSTAYKELPDPTDPNYLAHCIVLYDDSTMYEKISKYVPITATFTPHHLSHKPVCFYATKQETFDFMKDMIRDYKDVVESVRQEVNINDSGKETVIGVIDLCLHAGYYVDATKQTILAYLLHKHHGDLDYAWNEMVEWMGEVEDHWNNLGDLYRHWVIPALSDIFDSSSPMEGEEPESPISQYSD